MKRKNALGRVSVPAPDNSGGYGSAVKNRCRATSSASVSDGLRATGTAPCALVKTTQICARLSSEMRVIACGTGMPYARPKQAAACFLVELGNGDKFIFDIGSGSFERLSALLF